MRADAESSCPESRTDSWSLDAARNPWSAPTTELWAPTGTELELSGERLRDINAYMAHLDGPMVFCCPSDAEAVIEMLAAAWTHR